MRIKKIYFSLLSAASLVLLSSWTISNLSRQVSIPDQAKYESKVESKLNKRQQKRQLKKEAIQNSKQSKKQSKLSQLADRDGYIWFYDKHNRHSYFLSNFYPCSVTLWNIDFCCSEAAFQAAKFSHDSKLVAQFAKLNGEEAWRLAQKMSNKQRKDWFQVRENVMLEVLKAKFQQNAELADRLRSTGEAYLVEHTKRDSFWADGGNGKGKNRLGHLLMTVRAELGGVGVVKKSHQYKKFIGEN